MLGGRCGQIMTRTFFSRRALIILCLIFFLVPFGLRGARMSLERMENNVKDWLPDSFEETKELTWFAQHFVGEQSFILLTWEGCTEQDESYQLFVQKLRREIAPPESDLADAGTFKPTAAESEPADGTDEEKLTGDQLEEQERANNLAKARKIGDELGLYTTGDYHLNWGQLDEKWLRGADQAWYYLTPNGDLYRWHGRSNVLGATGRIFQRNLLGRRTVTGEFIATVGQPSGKHNRNDFYNDPRKLTARVLKSVTTGPDVLAELSAPGGPMWPIGAQYSEEERQVIARRRALDRLKGSLYGSEPFEDFEWRSSDLARILHESKRKELPPDWSPRLDAFVNRLVEQEYGGQREKLMAASLINKERHWKALFSEMGVDPPGIQTCVMVTLSKPGTVDLRRVIGRGLMGKPRGKLVSLAVESGVLPPSKPPMVPFMAHQVAHGKVLRMGGPPVDNVAIDEEGQITLVRLVGFSVLLGLGLSYICFHSVRVTLMVFMVGGISAVASLSIVWWSGSSVDAILMSMPSLVYVLGLSGAVHIVNYYREAVHDQGLIGAPERALAHGWWPCALAAFTTALGLLSLYQSNIFPIRKFGLFSAIGVMATLMLLFTYLPSALQLWPPGYEKQTTRRESRLRQWVHNFWQGIGNWVVDHHWQVLAGSAAVLIAVGFGLTRLNTSIQLLKLFDGHAKIIRDYRWLESSVGKIVPMELIVSVDPKYQYPTDAQIEQRLPNSDPGESKRFERYQFNFLERMELVSQIQNTVERVFGKDGQNVVGRALSAATFAPPMLDPFDSQRATLNRKLEENRSRILRENYAAVEEDGTELWRISVRLGALNDVDYGQFVSQLKRVVEPVLNAYRLRDAILGSLDEPQQTGKAPSSNWNGKRIAILGAADPRLASAKQTIKPVSNRTTSGADVLNQDDEALRIDESYAHVIADLLRAKGFQGLRRDGRTPKRFLVWHDPEKSPLGENATSEQWGKMLEKFDCVVLLADHDDYKLDFIRQHTKQRLIDARHHVFNPVVDQTAKQQDRPIRVTYTGVVPIVYKAQRTLLHSLINSIGGAFIMITAVMMILLRNRRGQIVNLPAGLISMIPNIFPVILIFGAMGHWGVLVDIGTMMTASVAMGVAVDDTIHFLNWFRKAIREGADRKVAIKESYGRVALAMTQTTLIGGLGLSVFALSTFTPTQRFGTMMLTLLIAALFGDLIVLPAILAGPLGKYFCPERIESPDPTRQQPDEGVSGVEEPRVLPLDSAKGRGVGSNCDSSTEPIAPPSRFRDHPHDGTGLS